MIRIPQHLPFTPSVKCQTEWARHFSSTQIIEIEENQFGDDAYIRMYVRTCMCLHWGHSWEYIAHHGLSLTTTSYT